MTERLTCSQGHRWESPAEEGRARICPRCGEAGVPGGGNGDHTIVTPAKENAGAGSGNGGAGNGGAAGGGKPMPFTIVRQHARGGLGQISLARDERIVREVAFKQILAEHADNPMLRKRFLYEARITGQLEHPSIVPVYTLGEDEAGRPYYVMRFVRGRTLDDIIQEHHASPNAIVFRELLRRFIAVCQAVAYAHARGVIHRDLKPSNIMLGDYGETLVLDWGLARDTKNRMDPALFAQEQGAAKAVRPAASGGVNDGGKELTQQGQIIGTPAYMAPEQVSGRTDLHAPVTDIYALGGILYKVFTGQSPQAPREEIIGSERRLTFVESPAPSAVLGHGGHGSGGAGGAVDPVLESICRRAMATDPAGRFGRALEMAQEIQRWLDEHPLAARPATALSRVKEWARTWGWLVTVVLLVWIAAMIGVVVMRGGGR